MPVVTLEFALKKDNYRIGKYVIQIWNKKEFRLVPILVDMLEETGYENPYMYDHLRNFQELSNSDHDRSCPQLWLMLEVLGFHRYSYVGSSLYDDKTQLCLDKLLCQQ